jgi:hypothetical protein
MTVLTITKNPYDFTDLKTTTDFENAVKKIEVKAVTKTGYKNLVAATGAGYLEVSKAGVATVGAILSSTVSTTLYDSTLIASYTGVESENSNYSDAYKFVSADGETNYLYTTKSPAATEIDALDSGAAVACTGTDGQTFAANNVYKLYLYDGKVVGYTDISANVKYVQVNSYTDSYLDVDIVAGTKDQHYEIGFATAYDLNTNKTKAIADTKGDVLALYSVTEKETTTYVFAQVVKTYTAVGTFGTGNQSNAIYQFTKADMPAAIQPIVNSLGRVNDIDGDSKVTQKQITDRAVNADGEKVTPAVGDKFEITIAPTPTGNYTVVSVVLQAAAE